MQTDIALEDETVAEKLQRHLSVSAVKRVVDDSLSTHHALSRHQSQSQGACEIIMEYVFDTKGCI